MNALLVARVETAKAARQPSSWIMLGIVGAYALVLVLGLSSLLKAPAGQGVDAATFLKPLRADALGFLTEILSGIGLIVLLVFATQNVGQEFSRGTLRTMLLARTRRLDVAWGKVAVLLLASLTLALLIIGAAALGALALSALTGEPLFHASAADVALRAWRTAASLGLWALLALGTTLLVRSPGVAIGSTLGVLIVGDILRGLLASAGTAGLWASRALPNAGIAAATSSAGVRVEDVAWIAANLLVWIVALNAWAVRALVRMDVIAATK